MYPPAEHDWWRIGPGKGMCRKCGEDDSRGMIDRFEDGRGVQMFCRVCANRWWVRKTSLPAYETDVNGVQITDP